jgi:hypothetical protein
VRNLDANGERALREVYPRLTRTRTGTEWHLPDWQEKNRTLCGKSGVGLFRWPGDVGREDHLCMNCLRSASARTWEGKAVATTPISDELFERSKNDRDSRMIVGSEIRAAIHELRQAIAKLEAVAEAADKLHKSIGYDADFDMWRCNPTKADALGDALSALEPKP